MAVSILSKPRQTAPLLHFQTGALQPGEDETKRTTTEWQQGGLCTEGNGAADWVVIAVRWRNHGVLVRNMDYYMSRLHCGCPPAHTGKHTTTHTRAQGGASGRGLVMLTVTLMKTESAGPLQDLPPRPLATGRAGAFVFAERSPRSSPAARAGPTVDLGSRWAPRTARVPGARLGPPAPGN